MNNIILVRDTKKKDLDDCANIKDGALHLPLKTFKNWNIGKIFENQKLRYIWRISSWKMKIQVYKWKNKSRRENTASVNTTKLENCSKRFNWKKKSRQNIRKQSEIYIKPL